LPGADEPSLYEILFKKDSDYIVGPLPRPADLTAFNDVLHRWTKLRESDDAWEAKCVIDAAGRIARKQLMEIVGKDIGRLAADLAIIDVVVKTLKAVDDRAAKDWNSAFHSSSTQDIGTGWASSMGSVAIMVLL